MGKLDRMIGAAGAALAQGGLMLAAAVAFAAPAIAEPPLVPLAPGLVVVAAVIQGGVDIEALRTIESVDDQAVSIAFRWTAQDKAAAEQVKDLSVTRIVRREDLSAANRMNAVFGTGDPDLFPGATAIQTSANVLQSLKSGSDTPFIFGIAVGASGGWLGSFLVPRKYYRRPLKRVERESVPFGV